MEINETGGARAGIAHASWPFAKLIVTKERMDLEASVIGHFAFRPSDVQSLEFDQGMFNTGGIRIVHNVPGYKSELVFLTRNPASLMHRINETGFLTNTAPLPAYIEAEIMELQSSGSSPIKLHAAVAIIVMWNALLIPSFILSVNKHGNSLSLLPLPGLLFLFFLGLAIQVSEPFGRLVLKPGHSVSSIRSFLWLIMAISLFMAIIFVIVIHFANKQG